MVGIGVVGAAGAGLWQGQELEVAHCGDEGVRDLAGLAHGVEVDAEVALGGRVHGAGERQPAAVELERGDVLRHGAGDDDVDVLGAGPHPPDDPLPRRPGALGLDGVGERRVGAEHPRHGGAHGAVGHLGTERAPAEVPAQALPVLLQEADGAEEARREDGAHAEHVGAVHQAAQQLRVHALVRVHAEDGLVGAGVHGVGVVRALQEVAAPVEARQHGARRVAARRARLRLHEVEVHAPAPVQPRHGLAHHRHQQAVQQRPPVHLVGYRRHQLALPSGRAGAATIIARTGTAIITITLHARVRRRHAHTHTTDLLTRHGAGRLAHLVRNSRMGLPERMGDVSPLAMRSTSGRMSS
uniref:Uncharacterized protein n=1 Tax=Zea mays TaxID=4577 RepID=A0A804UGW5_MAIZE